MLATEGAVYVGGFLQGEKVKARLEPVEIGPIPEKRYVTSWVGNSLQGPVTSTVSFNMTGLYTAPDGTCYTTSFFEEQGHCLAAYRDGKQVAPADKTQKAGMAVTTNGEHVFTAHANGVQRLAKDLRSDRQFVELSEEKKGNSTVRGLAANDRELFAGNRMDDRIEVLDAETLKPKRQFHFIRPGPLALDPQGRLWVIREGFEEKTFEFKDEGGYPHEAEIVCLDPQTGEVQKTFQGPTVPVALAFDPQGRLLVADNGPDQQVKIYDVTGEPKLVGMVGTQGGIFAGTPGEVTDGKFNGLTGVGCDAQGNIYVSSTGWPFSYVASGMMANATTLRAFGPEAINEVKPKVDWRLDSIAYIFDGATLNPKDETELYAGADQVFKMDWSQGPGREGTYQAFTANLKDYTAEAMGRRTRSTPWVRWLGGEKFLVLASGKRGLAFYRFEPSEHGEMAIPAAVITSRSHGKDGKQWPANTPKLRRSPWIWIDGSGGQPRDGIAQEAEYHSDFGDAHQGHPGTRWHIDSSGDVWYTNYGNNTAGRFVFAGLRNGVPTWNEREVIAAPAPFTSLERAHYDAETDTMVLAGSTPNSPGGWDIRARTTHVAVYDNWSEGNRDSRIEISLLSKREDYFLDGVVGFDVVGDFLYTTGRPGNVKVYDLHHGNRVIEFIPGLETNGSGGYFDNSQSAVQAFKLSTGEYVALCQENGWCKIIMYRWRPDENPDQVPDIAPEIYADTFGEGFARLQWRTGSVGMIKGYNVYRAEGDGPFRKLNPQLIQTPVFTDESVTAGREYRYKVTIVNAAGEGPASQPVTIVPVEPHAEFRGIDATTQGDWKGRYGSDGFYIVGDRSSPNNPTLPDYFRFNGAGFLRISGPPADPRGERRFLLKAAEGATERASFTQNSPFDAAEQSYLLEFTDGQTHRLTLYAAGVKRSGYGTEITLRDANTGELLDQRTLQADGPDQGRYISWNVRGAIRMHYHRMQGRGFGNYLNGLFFDPPAPQR